jgi:hypothetical protein
MTHRSIQKFRSRQPGSVTTMFTDKPHRLNGRTSLRLPPSRLGYPRSGLSRSDLVLWHLSDLPTLLTKVGYQGKSGRDSDITKPT